MFITTHAVLGALIGEQLASNPALAFGLGLASHYLVDIIPHGDSGVYKGYVAGSKVRRALALVSIDGIMTVLFVLFLFNTQTFESRAAVSAGIIGSVLPDLLVGLYELTRSPKLRPFHRVHFFFHNLIVSRKRDLSFASGFAMQMVFLAAILSRVG